MARRVVVNFSGGKDSTVAVLETLHRYPKDMIELVFMDTGAEYKGTKDHIVGIAETLALPLTILTPKRDWFEQIRHDQMPFTPALRKCTHRLKLEVYLRWLRGYRNDNGLGVADVVTVTGIRGEESQRRARLPIEEYDEQTGWHWRPCLHKNRQEILDQVGAAGLPIHYCYEFSSRCNCWLCIFAGKSEIRSYIEANPDEWEKACLLEDEIKKPLLGLHNKINDIMKQGQLL